MHRKTFLTALLFVPLAVCTSFQAHAGEKEGALESIIEKGIQELTSSQKLKIEKCTKGSGSSTHGKILTLSPCSPPDVQSGNVTIEMTTELYAGTSEPKSVLFVQYLFCFDQSTSQLILKQANSFLLDPGSGICGLPAAQLNNLGPGTYTVWGRVSTRNSDGSETIRDDKKCSFRIQ